MAVKHFLLLHIRARATSSFTAAMGTREVRGAWHSARAIILFPPGRKRSGALAGRSCPEPLWENKAHTQLFYGSSGFCPGLPGWPGARKVKSRKVKPIWIYWSKR